jgi:uncharacterized membrane-anchored protein YitT (DUF2179 family)
MSQQTRSHGETATGFGIVAVLWVGAVAAVIPTIVVTVIPTIVAKRVVDAIVPPQRPA